MKLHELFESTERSVLSLRGPLKDHFDGSVFVINEKLTSLKGSPSTVTGEFKCSFNDLENLSFAPETVGGSFSCTDNQLVNLVGGPKHVGGEFFCGRNELESLEGSPETVGEDFYCQKNKLKSLVGITKKVKDLCANGNQLTDLHNIHKLVDINGAADFLGNPITSHVLGLLMMPKLKEVFLDNRSVQKIINKHLQGGRDIFACQEELIEAGFEDYAQL